MARPTHTILISALLCLLISANGPVLAEVILPDYSASYTVEKYSSEVGRVTYRLNHNDTGYTFSQHTRLTGFISLFRNDTASEKSNIRTDGNLFLLQDYEYIQTGSEKDRNVKLDIQWHSHRPKDLFAHAKGIARGKAFEYDIPAEVWDPLTIQLALMRDMKQQRSELHYKVIAKGELTDYTFEIGRPESLEIDEVFYDTIELRRTHGSRVTRIWLSTDYDFIPVKIERYRDDELETSLTLSSLETEHD